MPGNVPYRTQMIPLADLIYPAEEMRSQVTFEGLDELAKSIRQLGLLNPITVRSKGGKWELIAGFRRSKAAEMCGWMEIPANIVEVADGQADLQKAHENIFREQVTPLDEGRYYQTILQKHNWDIQTLAAAVHKSPSYVSRRIGLDAVPDDIKQAMQEGKISLSIAEELARIKDDTARVRMLYLVVQNGATVEVVRGWRIQYETDLHFRGTPPPDGAAAADAAAQADRTKMGKLVDDAGPEYSLTESVQKWRYCHSCLAKTPEEQARLLVLCETCGQALERMLPGAPDQRGTEQK